MLCSVTIQYSSCDVKHAIHQHVYCDNNKPIKPCGKEIVEATIIGNDRFKTGTVQVAAYKIWVVPCWCFLYAGRPEQPPNNNFHVLLTLFTDRSLSFNKDHICKHFNRLILLSCKFNNFVTLAKHKLKSL